MKGLVEEKSLRSRIDFLKEEKYFSTRTVEECQIGCCEKDKKEDRTFGGSGGGIGN